MFKALNIILSLGSVALMVFGLSEWAQLFATFLVAVNAYYLAEVIY